MENSYKSLSQSKILIVYVYYERKNQQKNQTNLTFFLKYGLDKSRWENLDITTVLVINNKLCDVMIPKLDNLYVINKNSNTYSDYEGWYDGLFFLRNTIKAPVYSSYDYLCLMNASTFGPFMDEDNNSHWLYPFYNKMVKTNSVACSPYINNFENAPTLSCHFTFFKTSENLFWLLFTGNVNGGVVLSKKLTKLDCIKIGEEGLSKVLISNGYNVCSLFYESNDELFTPDYVRREFKHTTNTTILNKTIFIKNIWRVRCEVNNIYVYPSEPVLYKECMNFFNEKLKIKNLFEDIETCELDFKTLSFENNHLMYKEDYFNNYGFAEENIIFPKKQNLICNSCVIYAHYDSENKLSDYVIKGLKTLTFLGYDILFYTASASLNNIDLSLLPFETFFVTNEGAGTDYKIFLSGLKTMKNRNLNYEWVMFMNDSLLFPINGINNFIKTITKMRENCDFWGHWESNEVSWHLIGAPLEFKYNDISNHIISFLETTIPQCNQFLDYVFIVETKICSHLRNLGFKFNVVIRENELKHIQNKLCPSHNPYIISQWINNPKSFAIKWKYCISYLNSNFVSGYFNDLTKYLWYGPKGLISKGEKDGAFPPSEQIHKLFL